MLNRIYKCNEIKLLKKIIYGGLLSIYWGAFVRGAYVRGAFVRGAFVRTPDQSVGGQYDRQGNLYPLSKFSNSNITIKYKSSITSKSPVL